MRRLIAAILIIVSILSVLAQVGCSACRAQPSPEATPVTPVVVATVARPTPPPPTATPLPPTPTQAPPTLTPVPPTATPESPTPTSTSEPSTVESPTAESPTATPLAAPKLASSIEEIVGVWRTASGTIVRFGEGGTFELAQSVQSLDAPHTVNEVWFEGTQMFIRAVQVSAVPSCGDEVGIYQVYLVDPDQIELVEIEDTCDARRIETATTYKTVRKG